MLSHNVQADVRLIATSLSLCFLVNEFFDASFFFVFYTCLLA